MRLPRSLALVLVGLLAGLTVALGPAAPAAAHAALIRTDPPSGVVLPAAPAAVTLAFTEGVRPVTDRIHVLGPDRSRVDTGSVKVTGGNVVVGLGRDLPKGTYLVTFRVISADSHPIAGSFTFSIGAPSVAPPTADSGTDRQADPVVATALGAARFLGYVGLVLLVGPLLILSRLWPRRLSRRIPARLVAAGLITLAAGTAAEMYLQGPYTAGTGLFSGGSAVLREALTGQFGAAHAIRLGVLAAVSMLAMPFLRPDPPSTVDQAVVAFLGVIGIGTWPLAGHAAASPLPAVSMVADAAHLGAMSVWLGGLVMLVGVLLRRANGRELAAILPVWSSWALLAVITLALTGTAQAIIEVRTFSGLVDTTYGRLILAKATLLAVIVTTTAWFARRLVVQAAADEGEGAEPAAGRLRRMVLAELAITGVVLGLAAALVQTPPASTAAPTTKQPVSVTLANDLFTLRADLDPAQTGGNSLHLYAYDKAGTPKKVLEWKATATPVDGSVEPMTIALLPITDDHAVGEPLFPSAGRWELRFTLRVSEVDQATVSTTVTIT